VWGEAPDEPALAVKAQQRRLAETVSSTKGAERATERIQSVIDKPRGYEMLHVLFLSASVAQLVEQLTLNQLVHGSSPCRGTN
jgi:hypothetical protein